LEGGRLQRQIQRQSTKLGSGYRFQLDEQALFVVVAAAAAAGKKKKKKS
jgi:hypothetical protein